jgi:hypothetical protein
MTQGPLPIILLAASDHPDNGFRQRLWKRLENWLEGHSPRIDAEGLSQIIRKQTGTFLEPFQLEGETHRIAVFLVRLALSGSTPNSRFRLVSDETIGNAGGLVVTRSFNTFYSERYALGKNHLRRSRIPFFASSMKVRGPLRGIHDKSLFATMKSDKQGLYVEMPNELFRLVGWVDKGERSRTGFSGEYPE